MVKIPLFSRFNAIWKTLFVLMLVFLCFPIHFLFQTLRTTSLKRGFENLNIDVTFVTKNMNLVKNFVQLGGKSVNCAKSRITLKVALFVKEVKNRKHQIKIIRQILQKLMVIVQMNYPLQ